MDNPITSSVTTPINCHARGLLDRNLPRPDAKKIFIFCDGTGNKFQDQRGSPSANSNVVKLYTTLRVADNQVAYYHPGVGTMGDPNTRWAIPRWWSMVKGLAFGAGFQATVLDAYRYLMEVYNDGDEIYIFGFSRGAYTARAVAGLLHGYGLLCRGNEGHLLYAWNAFHDQLKDTRKLATKKRTDLAAQSISHDLAFAETYSRKVTIRFMGLWDTVSSVGWIYSPIRLLDMARNPIVQVARHAVSIDEKRAYYRDNLWGAPFNIHDNRWPEEFRAKGIQQDIAQVWFPGAHSDVGGSYKQEEAAPSNVTLEWMIGELQRNGALLCQERIDMVLGTPSRVYCADKIYTPPPEANHCLHDQLKGPWWVLQGLPQQYYDKEDAKIKWRVPYGTPRTIPNGSIIHDSAVRRIRQPPGPEPKYDPPNLKQGELTQLTTQVGWTRADLDKCWVYRRPEKGSTNDGLRLAKLAAGWVSFVIFFAVLFLAAWYLLGLAVFLARVIYVLLTHTPKLKGLFSLGRKMFGRVGVGV